MMQRNLILVYLVAITSTCSSSSKEGKQDILVPEVADLFQQEIDIYINGDDGGIEHNEFVQNKEGVEIPEAFETETNLTGFNKFGCRNIFHIASILVFLPENPAMDQDIEKIKVLQDHFRKRFTWATKGLADVVFESDVFLIEGKKAGPDVLLDLSAATKKFYETHPDQYEFLFIFDTFTETGPMHFEFSRIDTLGTGQEMVDLSELYGSNHVLLGITHLKSIRLYDISTEETKTMHTNGMLHEMVHLWCAYVDYIDENGNENNDLRNPMGEFIHWSKFLVSEDRQSVMGGLKWTILGNGEFLAGVDVMSEGLIPLDLYLMGLIPPEEVKPITIIVTDTPQPDVNPGVIVKGTTKQVKIEQIIKAEGKVECKPTAEIPR